MESPGLVETEDTVQALIDHLVHPLLPVRLTREQPTLSQQEAVGKQLHAVVLLYNYYHRKQFRQLEFLEFESFCKLATIAKSSLLMYMQFMREGNGPERLLSVTEKMVMDACSICAGLDASKDAPCMEEWPVSKVVVFLIDFTKKNCLLQFCSIVQGVWSPIEKDIGNPSGDGDMVEETKKSVTNKKRIVNGFSQVGFLPREDKLLQLAFSAVKEKSGIKKEGITVLEHHTTYSLSRGNSAAQFYLMQCTGKINEEMTETPIEDVVNSLQGPLVKKALTTEVTSVVDYFHLLPYIDILTNWLYRERHPDGLPPSRACQANVKSNGSLEPVQILAMKDKENDRSLYTGQTTDILDTETSIPEKKITNKKEIAPCSMNTLSGNVSEPQNMAYGSFQRIVLQPLATKDKIKGVNAVIAEKHIDKRKNVSIESEVFTENTFVDKEDILQSVKNPCGEESIGTKPLGRSDTHYTDYPVQDGMLTSSLALVPHQFNPQTCSNFQLLESKKNDLLQTSLRVLQKKRDELHQQQRLLEDEIARCEMNHQTIISEGEGSTTLKDYIIEACNTLCSNQTHVGTYRSSGERSPVRDIKRNKLSEAVLSLRSPCQDLDEICSVNNWILPRYSVIPSVAEGGFKANVRVKGMDFECTGDGDLRVSPQDARESAAGHMLNKLRTMANQYAIS